MKNIYNKFKTEMFVSCLGDFNLLVDVLINKPFFIYYSDKLFKPLHSLFDEITINIILKLK